MDTKYIINKDSEGRIHWVGIDNTTSFDTVEITDTENKPKYDYQLHAINAKTDGDFFESLENNQVAEVSEAFFTGETTKKYKVVKEAEEPLKTKTINKKLVAAGAAAAVLLASTTGLALNTNAQAKVNSLFGKHGKKTGASSNEEAKDLENKSVSELIEMLNDEEQEEAFNKIVNTQDYFNEEAAPTVSQGDKQLFFTFDETTAAYLYANAKAVSSEKLASFFGKSKIMLLNSETGEYEEMNKDIVSAEYLSFCKILSYYYQLGATEKSGVDQLFENEKEAEFFRNFEALILKYNKNHSKKVAAEIRKELENIFMSGEIDSAMNKYQGATSFIGTAIVPYLDLNEVIDKDMYKSIVEINETITCQDIYTQIEKIVNCKTKENGKEAIIEQIAKLLNEKVKDLKRNLSMEESLEGYRLSDLDNMVLGAVPSFESSKTVTKHYRTITHDRDEAERKTSAEDVRKAEEEARTGTEEKNKDQEDYWNGFTAGYNKAYNNVWNGGSGNVSIPSGSSQYVQGYKDGVASGIRYAKEDLKATEKAKENHKPSHHEEEIESETFVPENNDGNNYNNDGGGSSSESTEPAPSNPPQEEVVEETFVYENSQSSPDNYSLAPQRVLSIASHEDMSIKTMSFTLKDGTIVETKAKTLVRM